MINSVSDSEILSESLNPNTTEQWQQPPQSQSHLPNPNIDQDILVQNPISTSSVDDLEPEAPSSASYGGGGGSLTRRPSRRKRYGGSKRSALGKKFREKLQVLVQTLNPISFTSAKTLNFEKHQNLLDRLGLWDFVHLEFNSPLRSDLVAQLIASYVPGNRCGYVNGVRINVNRADLGRALKLPKKTVGVNLTDSTELRDSIGFVEELVYNWMLLHDDTYIMPSDVLAWLSLIKEGDFEKVDWAGLVWSMVEKELKAPRLVNCYYASHLQHLIKVQHEELLEEGVEVVEDENEAKEDEEENEIVEEEEEEEVVREQVDVGGDVKMGEVDEGLVNEIEEHKIELSLGQDNNVERVEVEKEQGGEENLMDVGFEKPKEREEEPGMWFLDQKKCLGEPFLRPCHGGDVKDVDCEQVREDEGEDLQQQVEDKDEEEKDGEEYEYEGGFHLSPKCTPMEGMTSGNGNLIQVMDAGQMPFGSGIDLRDNPMGDFLSSRDEPQMGPGSSLFGNSHKRDNMVLDNHNSHQSLNGSNKRLRSDSPWNSTQADFETCMEQMEHWMGKARMMYVTKHQACEESTMNQQLLIDELQKRDNMIDHLYRAKDEESQKGQMEVYRFEKELYMMQSLVNGYRKALKETRKAFAEYRAHCPQGDEPLYKDVPGSGGQVFTVMEVEKERLKKEAEETAKLRELMIDFEKKSTDLESTWIGEYQGYVSRIESLSKRLLVMKDQLKHLNEVNAKRKVLDPVECAQTTEGEIGDPVECAPSTEGEIGDTIECTPATEGEIGDPIECTPTTEAEIANPIECAPTTEAETA